MPPISQCHEVWCKERHMPVLDRLHNASPAKVSKIWHESMSPQCQYLWKVTAPLNIHAHKGYAAQGRQGSAWSWMAAVWPAGMNMSRWTLLMCLIMNHWPIYSTPPPKKKPLQMPWKGGWGVSVRRTASPPCIPKVGRKQTGTRENVPSE